MAKPKAKSTKSQKFTYDFPRPSVTVDGVIFGVDGSGLKILLIERDQAPFQGFWALPGGFVQMNEDIEAAAHRELGEETSLRLNTEVRLAHIEQLCTFGDPGRDPRGRVISVAYLALVRSDEHAIQAGSDARRVKWFHVDELPGKLAFDHREIIDVAIKRLRAKVRYAPVGFGLLPEEFTLTELRVLYEILLQRELDKRNFVKKIQATGLLRMTGKKNDGKPPAQLFSFDVGEYERLTKLGVNFQV